MIEVNSYIDHYAERNQFLEQFDRTQITLRNTTAEEQWIKVWGANEGNYLSTQQRIILTDTYPQAIAYNQLNGLLYVVNQLAATVQIFDQQDSLVKTVVLDSSVVPSASPTSIAINSDSGNAYVVGSLSDQLYVIDTNFEVVNSIALEDRPMKIQYNPINQKLYIQHIIGSTISVVNKNDLSLELVDAIALQKDIVINEANGKWAVVSEDGETIKIHSSSNQLLKTFNFEQKDLGNIAFTKQQEHLLCIDRNSNEILTITVNDGTVINQKSIEKSINQIQVIEENQALITLPETGEIQLLNEELNVTQTWKIPTSIDFFYYQQTTEQLYVVDSINSKVHLLNSNEELPVAQFSPNYQEVLTDFQHQPILVKHLKVFYSETNERPFFRVGFKSSAGKRESRLVSLLKYQSPQHFSKIYEVTELNNQIIDGRAFWEVFVPPELTVSLLIYHE